MGKKPKLLDTYVLGKDKCRCPLKIICKKYKSLKLDH